MAERRVDRFVVLLASPDTQACDEAASGQDVDGGKLLGEHHRVVKHRNEDAAHDLHPLGERGSRRQRGGHVRVEEGDSFTGGEARKKAGVDALAPL